MTYAARILSPLGASFGAPIKTGGSVREVVDAVVSDFEAHGFVVVSSEEVEDAADLFIAKPGTMINHIIGIERVLTGEAA